MDYIFLYKNSLFPILKNNIFHLKNSRLLNNFNK